MKDYEGNTPIFLCIVTGLCEWNNLAPFDKISEIWEKKYVNGMRKKLTIDEQSYFDFYPKAFVEYTKLVEFYNALSEEKKNQLYNDYQKDILFSTIKFSEHQ